MTEEEYFRKNNPDFCYGEKPLSPYWDLFQDGVEFSERQSEKRIEELELKNAELENKIADIKANCDFALEGKDVEIKELKEVLKGLLEEEEKGLWFKADGSDKSRYYKLREKAEKILER